MSNTYRYIDTNGGCIENPSQDQIIKELSKSYMEWKKGSGDACIEKRLPELIIIKVKEGLFLMLMSDYSSPLINEKLSNQTLTHYIGGEPFKISKSNLCNEKEATKIIMYYIENKGKLLPTYKWVIPNNTDF